MSSDRIEVHIGGGASPNRMARILSWEFSAGEYRGCCFELIEARVLRTTRRIMRKKITKINNVKSAKMPRSTKNSCTRGRSW
jgi:hypothetical protein